MVKAECWTVDDGGVVGMKTVYKFPYAGSDRRLEERGDGVE